MTDILKTLAVDVHCDQCGDFTIGADVIAESQRLLAEGCPGSPHECPPTLLATLLPQPVLESLETTWSARERALSGRPEPRSISRWEDDGGYVPIAPQSA